MGIGISSLIRYVDITFSPRIATGHSEPTYTDSINYTLFDSSGVSDDVAVASGVCYNCVSWKGGGSLDLDSTNTSLIFALGPTGSLNSNALDAGLKVGVF